MYLQAILWRSCRRGASSRRRRSNNLRWALTVGLVALGQLALGTNPAAAQALALKEALAPEYGMDWCGPAATGSATASRPSAAVDSLVEAGSRAAILGDQYTAGELLEEAALLDPSNPVIAYRLGRTYEERDEAELAVGQYCRYLTMAGEAPETGDVRERIERLAGALAERDQDELTAAVRAGLEAYRQQRYEASVLAFTRVLEYRPGWASAYYNRAMGELRLARYDEALADLDTYLQLRPSAEDRETVVAFTDFLRSNSARQASALPAPGGVLLQGLLIPGLGQFATGRPVGGVLVLGVAAAAAAYGLREVPAVRTVTATDPFGNPYEFETQVTERQNLALGFAVAGAVGVAAAVEAFVHASGARRVLPLPLPGADEQRSATAELYSAPRPAGVVHLGLRLRLAH